MNDWSNEVIAKIHLKTAKRTQYKVGGASGAKNLYLAVQPTGGKQWFFRKIVKGKSKSHFLGPFPEIQIEEAVQKAIALSREYWEGKL